MENELTRKQMQQLRSKTFTYLSGAGTIAVIAAMLEQVGYTKAVHEHGWTLLHAVSGKDFEFASDSSEARVKAVIVTLDETDEVLYRRTRAALGHLHPDQATYVLDGLAPATGIASVMSVEKILDRYDELESSPAREATREADHAALATLASRGITPEERKRLRELVKVAKYGAQPFKAPVEPSEIMKKWIALRSWYADWTEMARTVVKRRDQLILLGLAKRRKSEREDDDEVIAPPPFPAPPAPAPSPAPVASFPVSPFASNGGQTPQ